MASASNSAIYPSLRDRVAVVTGGASGIGEAIVQAFALQQAQVAFLDVQGDAALSLIERLRGAGATVAPGSTPVARCPPCAAPAQDRSSTCRRICRSTSRPRRRSSA